MRTYVRPAVLVLDEKGYLPLDRADANLVFQVVSKRYETGTGPIILTSNKAFSEWGRVFCDDVLAIAILDRLLHHVALREFKRFYNSHRHHQGALGGPVGSQPLAARSECTQANCVTTSSRTKLRAGLSQLSPTERAKTFSTNTPPG
jgi:hypothetical protein